MEDNLTPTRHRFETGGSTEVGSVVLAEEAFIEADTDQ
jgi:hypothetical protein